MDKKETCSEHQGLAISCSKIEDIHENILALRQEYKDWRREMLEIDSRMTRLETQKTELWKIQGWFNKGLAGVMITVIIAFKIFGGK